MKNSIEKIDINDAEREITKAGLGDHIGIVAVLDDGVVYVLDGGGRHYVKTAAELHEIVLESISSYNELD